MCFGEGHVVRKAVEESAESEKRGASFHEYCREHDAEQKKKTSMVVREERSRVASNEQQLGRPCDHEHGRQGDREVRVRIVVWLAAWCVGPTSQPRNRHPMS